MTSMVPRLDPRLGNVLFDVWLVSRAATARITEAVREPGLDADEFAIYSVLASTNGMTPTELAHWMAAPATTVSSYLKRFTRRGHVQQVDNQSDRRTYLVRLTNAGRDVHQAAGLLFLPSLTRSTDGWAATSGHPYPTRPPASSPDRGRGCLSRHDPSPHLKPAKGDREKPRPCTRTSNGKPDTHPAAGELLTPVAVTVGVVVCSPVACPPRTRRTDRRPPAPGRSN
jgi:DNA-binding MarR family transcriptional regulator